MTGQVASFTSRLTAVQEVFLLWGLCFAAIVVAFLTFPAHAMLVAVVCFLYAPQAAMRQRGEDYADYGLHFRRWRQDLKLFALVSAVVLPLFVLGFAGFVTLLENLPAEVAKLLAPYTRPSHFALRLPSRFDEWLVTQLLVVALPEEFFYRGFIQTRLRDAWPRGRLFLGVRLGPAFFVTALLFAVGHLAIFASWRLGVVFPALIFGWMREKTGSLWGAALFHATCNLLMKVLEVSFYGLD